MANIIEYGIGPRNTTELLWKGTGTSGVAGDHSNDTIPISIDISEKYLIFCWIYKEALIGTLSCSFTFGVQGDLLNNSTGTSVTDPKFISALSWRSGGTLYGYDEQWLFCCGYIFPSTTTNTATTYSGIYTSKGTKIYSGVDYRWDADPDPWAGETIAQSCSEDNIFYIARPSIYLCDEYEPNIKRMIGL